MLPRPFRRSTAGPGGRVAWLASVIDADGTAGSAKGGSCLVRQRHRGEQLRTRHFGAGLGDQRISAETAVVLLDDERDLFPRKAQSVDTPPETPPADLPIALDGGTWCRGNSGIEPAAPQGQKTLQFITDGGDDLVRMCPGRHQLGHRLDAAEIVARLRHESLIAAIASRQLSDDQAPHQQECRGFELLLAGYPKRSVWSGEEEVEARGSDNSSDRSCETSAGRCNERHRNREAQRFGGGRQVAAERDERERQRHGDD